MKIKSIIAVRLVLIFFIALTGCSGGSKNSSSNTTSTALVCDTISTPISSGQPLKRLAVQGLAGADESTDWVIAKDDQGQSFPTALYGNEIDGYEILVPLHPNGPQGGSITLQITDGSSSCPGIQINIEPMATPAGNPLGEMVSSLSGIADDLATQYGVDLTVLAATPLDELDPGLVPLALLVEVLSVFDIDTELAKLGDAELANLQGLFAVIGLPGLLNTLADDISALPTGDAVVLNSAKLLARTPETTEKGISLSRLMASEVKLKAASSGSASGCTELGAVANRTLGIDSPETLAEYIRAARGAADSVGPLKQGITDMNSGFMALGLVPGGGWATAGVGVVWGWTSYAVDLAYQMRANLYPSSVTHLTFELDENRIPEDWDKALDGEIKWNFAKLYATNIGMNLTRAVVDGTLNAVSSVTAAAGAPRGLLTGAEGASLGVADIVGRAAVDARLNELGDTESSCWNVDATEFGPVVVDDDTGGEWVIPRVVTGDAITVDDRVITANKIGTATLRVETNTTNLPGPQGFGDKQVEVVRKVVRWLPTTLLVTEAGQEETVQFRFDDTKHYEEKYVTVEPGAGISGLSQTNKGGGLYELKFTTSSVRDDFPLDIKVSSTSIELLPNSPPRSAILDITLNEEIRLAPREECVSNSNTLDVTATVSSIEANPAITWEIKSGSGILSGEGTTVHYTAPSTGSGSVTLRAYLDNDNSVEDEVTFTYGNCVDVAIFYQFDGQYNLPGYDPGCITFNDAFEEFDTHNDNDDNDGKNPEIPLTGFWGPGQQISISEVLNSTGQRAAGTVEDCAAGAFPAELTNDSTIAVGAGGDAVNYTIDLTANAVCSTFANAQADCSSASTTSNVYAVYELDIKDAADYQLEANMVCTFRDTTGFNNVSVAVIRYDSTESPVSINTLEPVIYDLMVCNSDTPVNYNRVVHFDAPIIAETTDRAVVQFITIIGAAVDPVEDGLTGDHATMDGSVRVYEVIE